MGSFDSVDLFDHWQALQRTLEFEEELAERFGGGEGAKKQEEESDDEGFDTKDGELTASAIRKKYKKQLKLVGHSTPCFRFLEEQYPVLLTIVNWLI